MSNGSSAELLKKAREEARATKGYQRIAALFDEGTFNEVDGLAKSGEGYAEVVAGYGLVDDCPVYAFAQNSDVAGGAMSKAQAAKIKKVYDLAVKTGAPVVGIYDSIGGRLSRGRRSPRCLRRDSEGQQPLSPVLFRRFPLSWVPASAPPP